MCAPVVTPNTEPYESFIDSNTELKSAQQLALESYRRHAKTYGGSEWARNLDVEQVQEEVFFS